MVATVTLSEPMINAIGAALDMRNLKLSSDLSRMVTQGADEFDIECVRDGIRDTINARLAILEAVEEEYPADFTYAQVGQD